MLIAFEMLCRPIPNQLCMDIDLWSKQLSIETDLLQLSRELANNAIAQATSEALDAILAANMVSLGVSTS